ncbi:MAG: hypothetical protein Q9211_001390 [Gyalolechia sp. 1 TL-2023]
MPVLRFSASIHDGIRLTIARGWGFPTADIAITASLLGASLLGELSRTFYFDPPHSPHTAIKTRFTSALSGEENPDIGGRGYKDFGEQVRDLDPVVDVIWISGTPSLQITFLLTIALTVTTSLQSFPFTPRPTFQFLRKLDLAFSSLLKGVNVATGGRLPGFDGGRGKLSTTEKVRMRGIVERTRVAVVEAAGKKGSLADVKNVPPSETDTDNDFNITEDDDEENLEDETSHRRWEMDIARVYEKTVVELGMALDASLSTDDGWEPQKGGVTTGTEMPKSTYRFILFVNG